VIGGVIARLDRRSPIWAERLRWRRARRDDVALRVVDILTQRGSTVLDIGASSGIYSVRMRDLVGRGGAVHAFEPNPEHRARLYSIAASGRVVVHPFALSDKQGTAFLHIPIVGADEQAGLASLAQHEGVVDRTLAVQTVRLDDVEGLPDQIGLIKCDVEGHEDAVISGAQHVIERSKPPILIEIEQRHRRTSPIEAFETFSTLGYTGWALFPSGLRPLECFDLERDQLAFVENGPSEPTMPRGYVHNFLFATPRADLDSVLDPTWGQIDSRSRA
jgi:FkbM family methyltransferase